MGEHEPTEREVEAAAEAAYVCNRGGSVSWGNISEQYKSDWRAKVTPVLLAASRARSEGEIDRENEQFNQGVTHTVELLAKELGVDDWVAGDGSEDYDQDLQQTLLNIIAAKGLYDPEDGTFAKLSIRPVAFRVKAVHDWSLFQDEEAAQAAAAARNVDYQGLYVRDGSSFGTEKRDHQWFTYGRLNWECCKVCGVVRRKDGKNSPCKGPVSVGPRAALHEGEAPGPSPLAAHVHTSASENESSSRRGGPSPETDTKEARKQVWPFDPPNGWDRDAARLLALIQMYPHMWLCLHRAKYIELRVDTRDCGFNLYDRDHKPLTPDKIVKAIEDLKAKFGDDGAMASREYREGSRPEEPLLAEIERLRSARPAPSPEQMREALEHARGAIASLGFTALGGHEPTSPEDKGYSFRDALLAEINAALSPASEGERDQERSESVPSSVRSSL